MLAKTFVSIRRARLPHRGVDGVDDGHRVAARVVAAEQVATQTFDDKFLGRDKHLRLGATKAVNALLRVTDQKHAGRPACAAVSTQPRRKRLPLQRVGVLEFVDHQMPDARVEPLLHPARQNRVGQHFLARALHVVHVDPAAFLLQGRELGDQRTRQARHALLVVPGIVLLAGRHGAQHQLLRLPDAGNADDLFAKFARRAGGGQQRGKHSRHVACAQGLLQLHALGRKSRRTGAAQRFGSLQQQLAIRRVVRQRVFGGSQPGEFRKLVAESLHRRVDDPGLISQGKLDPFVERRLQRLARLKPAMRLHHGLKVSAKQFVGHQHRVKPPPDQRPRRCVVFQQLVIDGQAQALQHRHRRVAQQRRKPAVEGTNLHRAPAGQHGTV